MNKKNNAKHFSKRFKQALDELEDATAKVNTLSDELLCLLAKEDKDCQDEKADFISRH